jgi:hypothetical protein
MQDMFPPQLQLAENPEKVCPRLTVVMVQIDGDIMEEMVEI